MAPTGVGSSGEDCGSWSGAAADEVGGDWAVDVVEEVDEEVELLRARVVPAKRAGVRRVKSFIIVVLLFFFMRCLRGVSKWDEMDEGME
jgi:hypothetical protein